MSDLITFTQEGIYCSKADVYIDPWKPVDKAIITHGHSDHARAGHKKYLTHRHSVPILKHRLGMYTEIQALEYGEQLNINGVRISLHPAGHIIGSSQVRLEHGGQVWVISGDYKLAPDGLCTPYEPVQCTHFITESTFGLPIFKWPRAEEVFADIKDWWRQNAEKGVCSVLVGYSLGKAQRLLYNLKDVDREIFAHGAIHTVNQLFLDSDFGLPDIQKVSEGINKERFKTALILAPPSAVGTSWLRRFHPFEIASASGWMAMRGTKRRRAIDRGFVLSDHADWQELNTAVNETGAEKVFVTHGYSSAFARWLRENGTNAVEVETMFVGEQDEIHEALSAG